MDPPSPVSSIAVSLGAHAGEDPADVDAHHAVEVGVGALVQRHGLELDGCGVDRAVEATETLDRCCDERLACGAVGDVGGVVGDLAANLRSGDDGEQLVAVTDIAGHHVGPGLGECERDGAPHTSGGARDDGDAPPESRVDCHLVAPLVHLW